jgi:hypothetical protein
MAFFAEVVALWACRVIEILVVVGATQQAGPIAHFGLLDVGLNIADR